MIDSETTVAMRIGIATLIGLATGLEREWSGHARGPDARFAGLRTFSLLGALGGIAGVLAHASYTVLAAALALGGVGLCVGGYIAATRRLNATTDGTTETAALTVIALGVVAGLGWLGLAAGGGAILVLMLREKDRLHGMVQRLDEREIRAGVQFAVLAVVVLPLLPTGPYFGVVALKPRALWAIVLLFSALNFAGFVARRVIGASRGLAITGALGGVISSTAVTLTFSRQSGTDAALGPALARGVIAASTVLIPRVVIVSGVLNLAVAFALVPFLIPVLVAGLALAAIGWRSKEVESTIYNDDTNPLRLGAAIRMALAFQVAIVLIGIARTQWGTAGVYTTASMLGLTDVDALTVSMSRPDGGLAVDVAARAIAIGILANTALKMVITLALGRHGFRRRAGVSLATMVAASVLGLLLV